MRRRCPQRWRVRRAPAHATVFAGSITLTDTTAHDPLNFSGSGSFTLTQTSLNTSTH
ncbi:hypothetical protein [Rhodopila sp.]|uniref:hypothetical protein n=1 Tax=Rhodopila sp. TaxID=2480087 RepID=UPI003D113E15